MLVYQRVNDGYCHVWLLEGNKILNSKEPNRTGSPFPDDFSSKGQELHLYGQDIILWCHTSCTMQGWQRRFAAFLFQMVCIYIYISLARNGIYAHDQNSESFWSYMFFQNWSWQFHDFQNIPQHLNTTSISRWARYRVLSKLGAGAFSTAPCSWKAHPMLTSWVK